MVVLLALRSLDEVPLSVASVVLAWTIDVVFSIVQILYPVCNPPSDTRDRKEDGVHISWETHGAIYKSAVEIHIGIQLASYAASDNKYKY